MTNASHSRCLQIEQWGNARNLTSSNTNSPWWLCYLKSRSCEYCSVACGWFRSSYLDRRKPKKIMNKYRLNFFPVYRKGSTNSIGSRGDVYPDCWSIINPSKVNKMVMSESVNHRHDSLWTGPLSLSDWESFSSTDSTLHYISFG